MKTLSRKLMEKTIVAGFLLAMIFAGASCPDPVPDPEPKARFTSTQSSTNHLEWTFTNQSVDADTYSWEFGDGNTSSDKSPTHTYAEPASYPATYTVKLTASKGTVTHSLTQNVVIENPSVATGVDLLYKEDGSEKTWKLAQVEASLLVGTIDGSTTHWSIKATDFPKRKCLFGFEYIFKKADNRYRFVNSGEMWAGGTSSLSNLGSDVCIPIAELTTNKDGADASGWAATGTDYTYQWADASGDAKAKLTLQGVGTFFGLPKISGDGTAEATVPATQTVYDVEKIVSGGTQPDTLVVNYEYGANVWKVTLVSYKSSDQEPTIGVTNPEASFTFKKDANNHKMYTFTNTSKFAKTYSWDFGDGSTSTEKSPTHTYTTDDDYTVTLTATGETGSTPNTATQMITVAPAAATPDATQDLDPSDGSFALTFASDVAFTAFGGSGVAPPTFAVTDNPSIREPNMSARIGKVTNPGLTGWEGVTVDLSAKFDFSTKTVITLSVYSPAVGAAIRFKLEDKANSSNIREYDDTTTVANAWETMVYEFDATADNNKFDKIAIFFGYEATDVNPKTAFSGEQVFYFDNIQLVAADAAQDLDPSDASFEVTFKTDVAFSGFTGTTFSNANNPSISSSNMSPRVGKIVNSGGRWQGIALELAGKFNLATKTQIEFMIYSPVIGTDNIIVKLEDKTDENIKSEMRVSTTQANTWQKVTATFATEDTNKFDKLVIFVGTDENGDTVADQTFYIDNIRLVAP